MTGGTGEKVKQYLWRDFLLRFTVEKFRSAAEGVGHRGSGQNRLTRTAPVSFYSEREPSDLLHRDRHQHLVEHH